MIQSRYALSALFDDEGSTLSRRGLDLDALKLAAFDDDDARAVLDEVDPPSPPQARHGRKKRREKQS